MCSHTNERLVNIQIASVFSTVDCLSNYVYRRLVDVIDAGGSAVLPVTDIQGPTFSNAFEPDSHVLKAVANRDY